MSVKSLLTATGFTLALAGVCSKGIADTPQYDFVEFRLVSSEAGNEDGDGFNIGGSFQINSDIYLRARYEDQEFENFNTRAFSMGAGYIYPLDESTHFFGEANIIQVDLDKGNDNADEDQSGFAVSFGLRTHLLPDFEARASINLSDVAERDTFLRFGGDFYVTQALSLGVTIDMLGDSDRITFGGRYHYR